MIYSLEPIKIFGITIFYWWKKYKSTNDLMKEVINRGNIL